MSKVLDVGCGLRPRGDVNVDLYLSSEHRRRGIGPHLDPNNIKQFVQADGRDMHMFSDRQFNTVKCYHVIEHVPDWWVLLRELWRVTDGRLIIVCPHRRWLKFPSTRRADVHVSNFDRQTWERIIPRVLGTMNYEVQTVYRGMFHKMVPFPLWPHSLRVEVWR